MEMVKMTTSTDVSAPLAAADQRPDAFHIRAASFQPVRGGYARQVLLERLGLDPQGRRALVVGSGHGLLARELARLGFAVTGLDPAAASVRLARDETGREGLSVDYEVGDPHQLAYPDQAFDVAYYADTLEITPDLDRVVAEAARVLRDQGAFLYDTVNRTALSRLIYLGALQSWPGTRVMPRHRYAWDRLRPPAELAATLADNGLRNQDVRGFLPASPLRLVRAMLRARRGAIDDAELADLAGMHLAPEGKQPPVTYLGFAVKGRSTP
jgi:2-polyprenyl-6-hydroxyphenyl methylase / 3-demethylubiquinone-9 3-methyltransferase